MRKYIRKENGYVLSFGVGNGYEEITDDQYKSLTEAMANRPEDGSGYIWRLRTDLVWEKEEVPSIELEPESDEILEILLGGLYE